MNGETKFKQTEIGMIPEDWKTKKVGDIFNVKNGKTNTQDAIEDGKYPLFDRSTEIKRSNKFLFDSEAIIVPGEGKEFIPRYFNGKFDLHQRAYSITPKDNSFHLKFFFYAILQFKDYLTRIAVGSTVRSLRLNHLTDFPVPVPTLSEQQAIAKILSDLDSKIELNQQMNKTLEAIGQALFKHWFIDFEFPNEEGKPYKSSGGEMVESELGEISKGWKISTIGGEFKTILGGTPSTEHKEYWCDGTIPWINSGKVNEFRIIEPSTYITKEALESSATKLMPAKTTVIAITGATLGQVSRLEIESCGNQSVVGVIESEKIFSGYVYFLIKFNIDKLISHQTGGAQQHINKNNINDLPIIIPDEKILNRFKQIIVPIFTKISNNCFSNKDSSEIRDNLLPKLMSGKIRVPI